VETAVDAGDARAAHALQLRLLGPLTVLRQGTVLPLPSSRKVRALLGYLALTPRAIARSTLCELLWESPDDPRGELRWCLSKLRGLVDDAQKSRVVTLGDTVQLELAGCAVDARAVEDALRAGVADLPLPLVRALCMQCAGDLLGGLNIERCPSFTGWLTAQRRRFRGYHAALLERLVQQVDDVEALAPLETWLQLAPFDPRVHQRLLATLARLGRLREGEEHLAAAIAHFTSEGLDAAELRPAWRAARAGAGRTVQATPGGVELLAPAETMPGAAAEPAARRASVAVMPLLAAEEGDADLAPAQRAARALSYDLITRLAKLRSLFVIAQGSVLALHERGIGPHEAGRMLDVDYVVGGMLQRRGGRLVLAVELAETRSARIVWAEVFNRPMDDVFTLLDDIGNSIVASVASEIERAERNRAILRPPSSLDAWEAHHRGLWHVYRFNQADNERAQHFFELATRLDPTFARAHAGLSFAHFQNAFQGWSARAPAVERAFAAAGQSLMADDRDPAAHWAMGRALWLRGAQEPSVIELQSAVDLSPNFAQGHYTLAFVQSQAGDPVAAIAASDHSRQLSPFDPLLFGMLGSRAMALVRLERFEEAADWAQRAAARPNAHPHIHAIAVLSLALAGQLDEARQCAARLRAARPDYTLADFLAAFHFDAAGEALFRAGARRVGLA
jgi:DNA-binding SARP family transcriptional activator/TolB-like protein